MKLLDLIRDIVQILEFILKYIDPPTDEARQQLAKTYASLAVLKGQVK